MSPGDPSLRLILNEELPENLRAELEKEAKLLGVSMNDVAGVILSRHFRSRWPDSGLPYREMAARFKLRVPEALHRKIWLRVSREPGTTVRGVTLSILAEHYKLPPIDPRRRPRRKHGN